MTRRLGGLFIAGVAMLAAGAAHATILDDPLHAFCWGTSSCTDNGANTPTGTNPPQFGFSITPGPQTGDFVLDVLVPNNETLPASFAITGTQGGAANNTAIAGTANLFSATPWTSSDLGSYLGIGASPNNPIGAYLPSTQALDAGATGFFVYQVDLGTNQLQPNALEMSGPLLTIDSLPLASYVVGFLDTTANGWIATANSGALFENTAPGSPCLLNCGGTTGNIPEPATLSLLGGALLGLGAIRRMRKR